MIINDLHVKTAGNPDNQAIIFVHGFPFDLSYWQNQIKALQDNYYCVAYDVRGLGRSYVGDGQYTIEAFVDDFYSIIKELKIKKPVVVGHSMGGYIILRAMQQARIKFKAAILTNTKAEPDSDAAKLSRAAGINKINVDGMKKFAKDFVKNCFAPEAQNELENVYKEMKNIAKNSDPTGVKGCLLAMGMRTSTADFLPEIKIPTLLLAGPFDNFMPTQILRDISEKIESSEFAIIPRSGHMSAVENPNCVNDLIKGFLKRIN